MFDSFELMLCTLNWGGGSQMVFFFFSFFLYRTQFNVEDATAMEYPTNFYDVVYRYNSLQNSLNICILSKNIINIFSLLQVSVLLRKLLGCQKFDFK